MSHSKLIEILSRTIKDGRVVSLIHKYLRSGVMSKGLFEAINEGTPQGGPWNQKNPKDLKPEITKFRPKQPCPQTILWVLN